MSTLNVGAMAARLGLDTSEFLEKMKGVEGFASGSGQRIANEMKRTNREGAESFRIIDEALGVHVSRPITRIVTQEFPSLAKGLQSVLGAGVVAGLGIAAFDFVVKGLERIGKAADDAKKKQEEFVASLHALQLATNEQTISSANSLDRISQKLAELSGDKGGALAAQLRIISRDDAEQMVRAIDSISEAYERNAKAAADAASVSTKFWSFVGSQTTGAFDKANQKISKQAEEIRAQFNDIVTSDPLKGMEKGAEFLHTQLAEAQKIQAEMHANQLSALDAFLAGVTFTDDIVVHRGAVTKEEVKNYDALVASLQKQLQITNTLSTIDRGNKKVARAESAAKPDIGEKQIEKLKAETAAQLALAAATGLSMAEQKMQQASGEADQIISRVLEEAHGKLTAAMRQELTAVHALTAERQIAKDIVQTGQELQKETLLYERQIASIEDLTAAYAKGGSAIEDALVAKRLEPDVQKLKELTDEYDLAKKAADEFAASRAKLGGAAGPTEGLNISADALAKMKAGVDAQAATVETHRQQLHTEDIKNYQLEITKSAEALRTEQPLLDSLNEAYAQNAEAVRRAQVALSLYHWEQAHPGQTVEEAKATLANPAAKADDRTAAQTRLDDIAKVNAQLEQQSINAQRSADAQLASRYSLVKSYDDEMAKLQRAKEVLQQYGQDTLAIEAAIYDERQRALKQWDDAAFKVGNFSEKYQAVMNELVIQGQQAGAQIAKAFVSAIDGAESDLAKLMTGQKVQPAKILQGLAEQVTKAEIQKGVGELAAHFNIHIPGMEAKLGTSDSNPMYVAVVRGGLGAHTVTKLPGIEKSPLDAVKGMLGLGKPPGGPAGGVVPDGSQGNPFYVVTASPTGTPVGAAAAGSGSDSWGKNPFGIPESMPKNFGITDDFTSGSAVYGPIMSMLSGFGGGLATGGDVHSGTTYMVGENGPELFRASAAGEIIPSHQLPEQLIKNANAPWTFDPHAGYAKQYESYERWLHRSPSSGLFGSLLSLGGLATFKEIQKLMHPAASRGTIAAGLPAQTGVLDELNAMTASASVPASSALGATSPFFGSGIGADASFGRSAALPSRSDQQMSNVVNLPQFPASPDFAIMLDGFRAAGGDVKPGGTYMVGEHGPELFRAPTAGEIIPNHLLDGMSKSFAAPSIPAMPDFGGFMADGGDVFPGISYLVMLRGPELLRIPALGQITSNSDLRNMSNQRGDTNSHNTNITQHFNGEKDNDLFRRTVRQETVRMFRH